MIPPTLFFMPLRALRFRVFRTIHCGHSEPVEESIKAQGKFRVAISARHPTTFGQV